MATPNVLLANITAGKFKPAYYFFGEEDYRIVEAEKFVVGKFLPDRQRVVNYRKINGRRTPCADLMVELSSLPLLGERQIIAVSSFQSYKPKEIKQILSLLTPPDPNRVVIFSSPSSVLSHGRSAFMKKAFFKNVSQAVETVEFGRLTARQVSGQLVGKLKKAGLQIDSDALSLLIEMLAGNRGGLDSEVDKLINYKNDEGTVTIADVRHVCSGYEVFNIFELADQIVAGKTKLVLKMMGKLLADGNSHITITTLLQQHFICLYLVKNGKKPLDRRNWLVPKFREQANRYDNASLEKAVLQIAQTDSDFRHSTMKPETALELLALSLMADRG